MTKVLFKRKTSDEIANLPVEDGALIYNYETGATYLDYDDERIPTGGGMPTGDTFPIGAITSYAGSVAPTNWLICDGSAISRTTYADLFNAIGTTYGAGDGNTTFNLPNLKGRVITGLDTSQTEFDTLGETGGEKTHTLIINEMPEHSHRIATLDPNSYDYYGLELVNEKKSFNTNFYTEPTGGSQPHNNLQPYITLNYIIKAFQSVGTVANVVNITTDSDTDTYSCNYVNGLETYSTSETRIGTWINNKPIYRIVKDFESLSSRTNNSASINVTSLNVDTFTDIKGAITDKRNILLGDSQTITWNPAKTSITIYFNNSGADTYRGYVIIEYTKTND